MQAHSARPDAHQPASSDSRTVSTAGLPAAALHLAAGHAAAAGVFPDIPVAVAANANSLELVVWAPLNAAPAAVPAPAPAAPPAPAAAAAAAAAAGGIGGGNRSDQLTWPDSALAAAQPDFDADLFLQVGALTPAKGMRMSELTNPSAAAQSFLQRAKEDKGLTRIHYAVMQPNLGVLCHCLTAEPPGVVSQQDTDGVAPLHIAVTRACLCGSDVLNGGAEVQPDCAISILLAAGALINARTSKGYTALHMAAASHHQPDVQLRVVQLLIKRGASVNIAAEDGTTPLHFAASGSTQLLQVLLSAGADAKACTSAGVTPLMLAALHGRLENCHRLLQRSGYGTAQHGSSALSAAVTGRHLLVVRLLLRFGVKCNSIHLHVAASHGDKAILDELLGAMKPHALTRKERSEVAAIAAMGEQGRKGKRDDAW